MWRKRVCTHVRLKWCALACSHERELRLVRLDVEDRKSVEAAAASLADVAAIDMLINNAGKMTRRVWRERVRETERERGSQVQDAHARRSGVEEPPGGSRAGRRPR
jgi:NADP-dependent 3-hydroxy acid dehydrogenase YdfG